MRSVSLRRAGVRSEKIHGKRVTQVKPHHRKDTIFQDCPKRNYHLFNPEKSCKSCLKTFRILFLLTIEPRLAPPRQSALRRSEPGLRRRREARMNRLRAMSASGLW